MFHKPVYVLLLLSVFQIHAQDSAMDFYIGIHSCEYPLIIDTRTYKEFRQERIPGAILCENRSVLESILDSLDLDQHIFVYCDDGDRSLVACRILARKGFRNVYNLSGGLIEWKLSSYDIDLKKIRRRRKRG